MGVEEPIVAARDLTVDASKNGHNIMEPDVDDLDAMLAQAMVDLSIKEREESFHDVYGVAEIIEETPDFIKDRLTELDKAITTIPNQYAYARANTFSPHYVSKFKLMALRATSFDAKQAAKRLVMNFEKKLELFGVDKLTRDIQLSDLDETDMLQLESGVFQLLPVRDRAGRAIICVMAALGKLPDIKATLRIMWYIGMVALEDEETQKNGTVLLFMNIGQRPTIVNFEFMRQMISLRMSILDRVVGVHYCYESMILRPILTLTVQLLMNQNKARFRTHYGTYQEIQFQLLSYGIPTKLLPVQGEDSFSIQDHLDWLQRRRKQEGSDSQGIILPRRFDVLFGRGKIMSEHTGNLRVFHIVEMHRQQYEQAGKYRKTEIAERIVKIIHESNGRFLKQDQGGWEEVADDVARDKISHFFRKLRSTVTTGNRSKESRGRSDAESEMTSDSGVGDYDSKKAWAPEKRLKLRAMKKIYSPLWKETLYEEHAGPIDFE